jgi:hypothetical protein
MTMITYTLPRPGEDDPPNHDEFCAALADCPLDWEGDECGIVISTPEGAQVTLEPGTTVRLYPSMLWVLRDDTHARLQIHW